jgi:hypothetical protein
MNYVKLLTAAVLLTATLPLGAASAQGRGAGPCTPPVGVAVGAAGPAMNGGQLMAGVGQCAPIGGWHRGFGYSGGYEGPQIALPPVVQSGDGDYGGGYPY